MSGSSNGSELTQQELMDAARAKRAAAKQVGADRKAQTQLQRAVTKAPGSSAGAETADEAPARLRRAEAILRARTGRFALVLERVSDSFNQSAVLRSAEAFGVQHIFVVEPTVLRNESTKPLSFARQITKNCHRWLTVSSFSSTAACLEALREQRYQVWATDLSAEATCVDDRAALLPMPPKVAIVIGRESDGVSAELLAACDRRVFIPMFGFTESFNLSVACALILQRLFDVCPEARGDLPEAERRALRTLWFGELARNPTARAASSVFLAAPALVLPLDDLRRPDAERGSWAPPKVKKREAEAAAAKAGACLAAEAAAPEGEGGDLENKRRHIAAEAPNA